MEIWSILSVSPGNFCSLWLLSLAWCAKNPVGSSVHRCLSSGDLGLSVCSRAYRCSRLPLLHIVYAAFSDALLIRLDTIPAIVKSAQAILCQSHTGCSTDGLLVRDCLSDWEGLELDISTLASGSQYECTNQHIQVDLFLALLHQVDNLISDQLQNSLHDIRPTVAHISNCLQAGTD